MPNTQTPVAPISSLKDSDALMVDLIWPLSRGAGGISSMRLLRTSFTCLLLFSSVIETALGEVRTTKSSARGDSGADLRQPNHFLPMPANTSFRRSASERTTRPLRGLSPGSATRSISLVRSHAEPATADLRGGNEQQAIFQTTQDQSRTSSDGPTAPDAPTAPGDKQRDRCASLVDRPFSEFDIETAMSGSQFPDDYASQCWAPINEGAGPLTGDRCWGATTFNWNATCLCHRPLYFEEINLERYGYGCCECLQPAASAAHFFATIPTLPYCIATDCPCECIYTLGHYRPGSCPPWQCHWPRWSTRAALAEGGVWTGLVFMIP
jgi:hypothetical protein